MLSNFKKFKFQFKKKKTFDYEKLIFVIKIFFCQWFLAIVAFWNSTIANFFKKRYKGL